MPSRYPRRKTARIMLPKSKPRSATLLSQWHAGQLGVSFSAAALELLLENVQQPRVAEVLAPALARARRAGEPRSRGSRNGSREDRRQHAMLRGTGCPVAEGPQRPDVGRGPRCVLLEESVEG